MSHFNVAAGFSDFAGKVEKDLQSRFPNIAKSLDSISIGRNIDPSNGGIASFKISPTVQKVGMYASCDSRIASYVANPIKPLFRIESPEPVLKYIKDSKLSGKSEDAIKKEMDTNIRFDIKTGQYVVTPVIKGVSTDALIPGTALSPWNVGYLNKVFKQPFTQSFAKHLVSVEGFGNAWCDAVAVFKESFEGFGRISSVGRGSIEANASSPVSSEMGQIMTDIVNIAVDYESSIEEQLRGSAQPGNFLSPMANGDRERYANMVLERIHDALILFGNTETNTDGLLDVATGGVVAYTGTPLNEIVEGVSTSKGSLIVEGINSLIAEFLRENLYMAKEIKISCSTYVMKAMTSTTYSQQYNPATPMEVIRGRFDASKGVGGGVQSIGWSMVADPMLDPNTPFNPNNYDLFIITVPSVASAMDDQHGLVISPEPLKQFIVPPMYQRSGYLYTMYKRVGGIIAPIVNTVRVWSGVGYAP